MDRVYKRLRAVLEHNELTMLISSLCELNKTISPLSHPDAVLRFHSRLNTNAARSIADFCCDFSHEDYVIFTPKIIINRDRMIHRVPDTVENIHD